MKEELATTMKYFFQPATICATMGKSAKGRALQEIARKLDRMLVDGDDAPVHIVMALRMAAAALDVRFPRTRPTLVDYTEYGGSGQLWAQPVSGTVGAFESATYFRIPFDRVRETADTAEVIKTITGSINPEKDDDNDIR